MKGYFDVRITVETSGGHSSVPPDHTGIGILSQVISAVEAEPYEPELTPANRQFPYSKLEEFANLTSLLHHLTMLSCIRP
jgi:acetylornithine deacetylase/succinyl-diaminopimelate desuccinylase-like protein